MNSIAYIGAGFFSGYLIHKSLNEKIFIDRYAKRIEYAFSKEKERASIIATAFFKGVLVGSFLGGGIMALPVIFLKEGDKKDVAFGAFLGSIQGLVNSIIFVGEITG